MNPQGKRLIQKVKYSKDRVKINYLIVHPDERTDAYAVDCVDRPRVEFDAALQKIADELCDWCELPEAWFENVTVLGVSFSFKDGNMGAVVTFQKPIRYCNSPLILNAPHKAEHPYSEGGDYSVCLTKEQIALLKDVIAECEKYLDGDRAQMRLPLEEAV